MKAVRASATRLRAMGTAGSGPAMKRQSPFCRLSTRIGGHDEGGPARGGAARCDGDGADRARLRGARALVSRVCRLSTSSPGLMRQAMLKVSSHGAALREPIELLQLAQEALHLPQRHHVRTVGWRLVGVLVGLDEDA